MEKEETQLDILKDIRCQITFLNLYTLYRENPDRYYCEGEEDRILLFLNELLNGNYVVDRVKHLNEKFFEPKINYENIYRNPHNRW